MHQGFLSAIRDDPDSDEPRLIYADWLEDNGNPDRAEFIRVQCRLARMEGDEAEFFDLQERQWSLLAKNQDDWLRADFPVRVCQRNQEFKRGFLRWAECTAHEFATLKAFKHFTGAGLRLGRGEPLARLVVSSRLRDVTELHVEDDYTGGEGIAQLAQSPHLGRLIRLRLPGYAITDSSADALAACERFDRLADLDVSNSRFAGLLLEKLAGSPHLGKLRRLALGNAAGGDPDALDALARSQQVTGLRALELFSWFLGPEGGRAIGGSSAFGELRTLSLPRANLSDYGVRYLATARHLVNLQHLNLRANGLCDAPAILARSSHLPALHTLNLSANDLRADEVPDLMAADALPGLRVLDLSHTSQSNEALTMLAEQPGLARLTGLHLSGERATGQGFGDFFASADLSNLRSLTLTSATLGLDAVTALGRASLPNLRVLVFDHVRLTAQAARALAEGRALANLRSLSLTSCALRDEATQALLGSLSLPELRELNLGGNLLTPPTVSGLLARFPRLHTLDLGHNPLGNSGVTALANDAGAARLRVLNVSTIGLGDVGGMTLVASPYFDDLGKLTLLHNSVGSNAVTALKERFGTRVRI